MIARMGARAEAATVAPLPGGWGPEETRAVRDDSELDRRIHQDGLEWRRLRAVLGAWRTDTVAVLCGHTGRGKTALAVQMAEAAASFGAPVLYASMELGCEELVARFVAVRANDAHWVSVKRGLYSPAALTRVREELIDACPALYLWAPGGAGVSTEGLARMVRAIVAVHGKAPFVVLDYVQRLATGDEGNGDSARRLAVSKLSGQLRTLSRPGEDGGSWPGAAILALSSVSRAHYTSLGTVGDLKMAEDIDGVGKESGEIEYDAPIVLAMASNAPAGGVESSYGRDACVRVVKNREGTTGATVDFLFLAARGVFLESDVKPAGAAAASSAKPKRGGRRS